MASTTRIVEVYGEAITEFGHIHCPEGLSYTFLSQGCVLADGSQWEQQDSGWNIRSKLRGQEEPLIVQGQLVDQPVVTFSRDLLQQAMLLFQKCSPVVQSATPDPLSLSRNVDTLRYLPKTQTSWNPKTHLVLRAQGPS